MLDQKCVPFITASVVYFLKQNRTAFHLLRHVYSEPCTFAWQELIHAKKTSFLYSSLVVDVKSN